MDNLGDGLKKVLLAGIGAVAVTAEKSKEILDEMVKRGELTVEQGKVLNKELKHNIRKTVKENVKVSVKPSSPEELSELLDQMTPEQIEALKAGIQEKEEKQKAESEKQAEDDVEAGEKDEAGLLPIVLTVKPFYASQIGGADSEIMELGIEYLSTVMIFSFGLFTQVFFERLLTSTGRTIFSMTSQLCGAVTNIILDPILIFGLLGAPKMGVTGAAVATVIGQCMQ